MTRCSWCSDDPLYVKYHDEEWGVPSRDDRHLFEKLILEGAQAGLSWITILRMREAYRKAFHAFDAERMARYGEDDVRRLLADPGIVRNEKKIRAAIQNARACLALREKEGGFAPFLWSFVEGNPIQNKAFPFLGTSDHKYPHVLYQALSQIPMIVGGCCIRQYHIDRLVQLRVEVAGIQCRSRM